MASFSLGVGPFSLIVVGALLAAGWSIVLPPGLGDWRLGLIVGGVLVGVGLAWYMARVRNTPFDDVDELDDFLIELLHRRGYDFPPEAVGARGLFPAHHSGGCSLIDLRALDDRRVGASTVRRLIRDLHRHPQAQNAVLLVRGQVTDAARDLARHDRVAVVSVQSLRESLRRPPAPASTARPHPVSDSEEKPRDSDAIPWDPGLVVEELSLSWDELRASLKQATQTPSSRRGEEDGSLADSPLQELESEGATAAETSARDRSVSRDPWDDAR